MSYLASSRYRSLSVAASVFPGMKTSNLLLVMSPYHALRHARLLSKRINGAATSATGDGSLDQTAAEDIRQDIEAADSDPSIKAVLLQIDSPGGDTVAGEDVANALQHASKPTVALVADEGTSAAYWAATSAQTIFASANSSLADIGVTQSYLKIPNGTMRMDYNSFRSPRGNIKIWATLTRRSPPEEKTFFKRDLTITDQNFIAQVAENRAFPLRAYGTCRRFIDARENGAPERAHRINRQYL